jgi:hypothetical protein
MIAQNPSTSIRPKRTQELRSHVEVRFLDDGSTISDMARRMSQLVGLRAAMTAVAEAAGLVAIRRPYAAAGWYGGWTLVTAFGFALVVLVWIVLGRGPGGRLVRLDPSWAPARYPPTLRSATEALSERVRQQDRSARTP